MGEHEQLNLNKFVLKPHLSLKVEGEPLPLILCFSSRKQVAEPCSFHSSFIQLQLLCDPSQEIPLSEL